VASATRRASEESTEIETSGAGSAPGDSVPAVGAPESEVLVAANTADAVAVSGNGAGGVHGQESGRGEVDGGRQAVEVEVGSRGNERGGSDGGVEVQITAGKQETRGGGSGVELEVGGVQGTITDVGGVGSIQVEINGAVEGTVGSPEAVTVAEAEERTLWGTKHEVNCAVDEGVGNETRLRNLEVARRGQSITSARSAGGREGGRSNGNEGEEQGKASHGSWLG